MTARVHYADLWGEREVHDEDADGERVLTGGKYHWLWQNEISTTKWTELERRRLSICLCRRIPIFFLNTTALGW